MSTPSVGLDQTVGSSSWRSSVRTKASQDFEQLFQSLQSGNLNSAQQAYSSFQQIQAGQAATSTNAAAPVASASPIAADWSALGQALQSGSLSSAQSAFGKLQTDAQSIWQSHVQQETKNAESIYALMQSAQPVPASSGATPTGRQPMSGSVQNDLGALGQALQSGDTASAQKVLAQLVQDLQASAQAADPASASQTRGHHHHHHHHPQATAGVEAVSVAQPGTSTGSTFSPSTV